MKFSLKLKILLVSLLLLSLQGFSQEKTKAQKQPVFRIMFYNVENLFDTIDDPLTNDADFLPDSRIAWNTERYDLKLAHTGKVIAAVGDGNYPAIVGMAEVENRRVLEDLLKTNELSASKYEIIQKDSPDERGIDCAMLYRKGFFKPTSIRTIPVIFPFAKDDHTRDILYVKGKTKLSKKETLHIFVNHWPSRYGGQATSNPLRLFTAQLLKNVTDSILSVNPDARIIIMGDLNDEPGDQSVRSGLHALPVEGKIKPYSLYNLMYKEYEDGEGTLYYKDWDMFDQFIVSSALLNASKGIEVSKNKGNIFNPEWLMFKSKDGTLRPNRTAAKDYYGGYSDHLPVYIDLIKN